MNRPEDRINKSRKKSVNLSIPADIIQSARDLDLNLSEEATAGIRLAVKKAMEEQWLRDNSAALQAYNDRIDREGLPLQAYWIGNNGAV
jgi:antitoxin CcdA